MDVLNVGNGFSHRTFALNALPRIVRICKRQDDSIQVNITISYCAFNVKIYYLNR